jgi:hypothetical protein
MARQRKRSLTTAYWPESCCPEPNPRRGEAGGCMDATLHGRHRVSGFLAVHAKCSTIRHREAVCGSDLGRRGGLHHAGNYLAMFKLFSGNDHNRGTPAHGRICGPGRKAPDRVMRKARPTMRLHAAALNAHPILAGRLQWLAHPWPGRCCVTLVARHAITRAGSTARRASGAARGTRAAESRQGRPRAARRCHAGHEPIRRRPAYSAPPTAPAPSSPPRSPAGSPPARPC